MRLAASGFARFPFIRASVSAFACALAAAAMVLALGAALPTAHAAQTKQNVDWQRLEGDDAYGTMQKVVGKGWPSSQTVMVATFDGYWDALAASSVAGMYRAPVLLTGKDALAPATRAQIERLDAKFAVICGGEAVVSKSVERELVDMGLSVERHAGDDAQLTALDLARTIDYDGFSRRTCIVATSGGYWDALAASPYAYATVSPIYLTNASGTALAPEVRQAIVGNYDQIIIMGGEMAVSPAVEAQLRVSKRANVVRMAGDDAYHTAAIFAQWAIGQKVLSPASLGVATAGGYWDALTGAALCGITRSALLLADDGHDSFACEIASQNKFSMGGRAYVFGGNAAVGKAAFANLQEATKSPVEQQGQSQQSQSQQGQGQQGQSGQQSQGQQGQGSSSNPSPVQPSRPSRPSEPETPSPEAPSPDTPAQPANPVQPSTPTNPEPTQPAEPEQPSSQDDRQFITLTLNDPSGENADKTVKVVAGQPIGKLPVLPARSGYKFGAWYPSTAYWATKPVTPNSVFYGDTTLYAYWEWNSYQVYFVGNNAQYANAGAGSMESQRLDCDKASKLSKNQFTREGYVFDSWNTEPDGSGTRYADQQSVKGLAAPTSSVTLYAQWRYAGRDALSFDGWRTAPDGKSILAGSGVRQPDGSNAYTLRLRTTMHVSDLSRIRVDVQDVTPAAYREMFEAMNVDRSAPVASLAGEDYQGKYIYMGQYYYPQVYFDDGSSVAALSEVTVTVNAGMGVRALKVTAYIDGKVAAVAYTVSNGLTAEGKYSPFDEQLYADVRHRVEAALWTDDMTNAQKLQAIASYINATTHYPDRESTSREGNPEFWERWSVDDIGLYYSMANDTKLNRIMRFQGGICTCQASDSVEIVGTEDLGLPYLYDSASKTVLDGEGVWTGMGNASSSPDNPAHETCWYKDASGQRYALDAQGRSWGSCAEHKCRERIVPLTAKGNAKI